MFSLVPTLELQAADIYQKTFKTLFSNPLIR